ncbi:MAG: hypothetical protein KC478_09340 [Bacteriovoracaceae bacterium]|nr:hypothetical protein [Bacteriovoracaceae bacterium]
MKCFSLLLLFSTLVTAEIFTIRPIDKTKISTGDVLSVQIEAKQSSSELPELVGERIGGVFYVLEQNGEKLKVIVANPQSVEGVREKTSNQYRLVGFDYEFKKSQPIQDFIIEDKEYDLDETMGPFWLVVISLITFGIFFIIFKLYRQKVRDRQLKERKRADAHELLNKFKKASTREELEELYLTRNEVRELIDFNEKHFLDFLQLLDSHQYKKEWSESELLEVREKLSKLNKNLSVKSGI